MKQIPERRLSSVGRLPSDIDGDDQRVTCDDCGKRLWESEAFVRWTTTRGSVTCCRDCSEWAEDNGYEKTED